MTRTPATVTTAVTVRVELPSATTLAEDSFTVTFSAVAADATPGSHAHTNAVTSAPRISRPRIALLLGMRPWALGRLANRKLAVRRDSLRRFRLGGRDRERAYQLAVLPMQGRDPRHDLLWELDRDAIDLARLEAELVVDGAAGQLQRERAGADLALLGLAPRGHALQRHRDLALLHRHRLRGRLDRDVGEATARIARRRPVGWRGDDRA